MGMRRTPRAIAVISTAVLALAGSAHAANVSTPGEPDEWRFVTPIFGDAFCGGSLISPSWVLTAAHCVRGVSHDIHVAPGTYALQSPAPSIRVRRAVTHPAYLADGRPAGGDDPWDLALLELETPARVAPIDVPAPSDDAELARRREVPTKTEADMMLVAGWGYTDSSRQELSDILTHIHVPVLPMATCTRYLWWSNFDPASMVCAGIPLDPTNPDSVWVEPCHGDSGGPLVVPNVNGRNLLGAVASWATGECNEARFPGVYSRVFPARDWICDTADLPARFTTTPIVNGYRVAWDPDGPCPWRNDAVTIRTASDGAPVEVSANAGSATISGLLGGRAYAVTVEARATTGATHATSTQVEPLGAPVAGGRLRVTGIPHVGRTLRATGVRWRAQPDAVITYRWQRSTPGSRRWRDVPGARRATHRLGTADHGRRMRVRVTARNAIGTTTATSPATSAVH